ncbi:MAG: hemolysin III family protein [Clostridiales bacterium]|nr:hemolysin III family protein [Clostridiales bacterium]
MSKKIKRIQSLGEEIANAISHGAGTLLSVAGLVVLIVTACTHDMGAIAIVSAALYGAGLTILYTSSSLYHSLTNIRAKKLFRIFDHCSIFLLILSSYIPIFLVVIGGALGWTMFGISVFCTVIGIVFNSINLERWDKISQVLYIIMGWQAIIIIVPLYRIFDTTEFILLIAGGVAYTAGVIFYRNNRLKYMHFIWHIFVLIGSVLHYFMILHFYMR